MTTAKGRDMAWRSAKTCNSFKRQYIKNTRFRTLLEINQLPASNNSNNITLLLNLTLHNLKINTIVFINK
jgi:hypothetical protein